MDGWRDDDDDDVDNVGLGKPLKTTTQGEEGEGPERGGTKEDRNWNNEF